MSIRSSRSPSHDLPWVHVPKVSAKQLQDLLEAQVACVVYVYSPTCGACVARFKAFDDTVGSLPQNEKNRFFRYNAVPSQAQAEEAHEKFKQVTGASIQYYPTVYGFAPGAIKGRRVFEYSGDYGSHDLMAFLRSLQNGQMSLASRK
jgi:hypothetical protein